MNFRYDYMNPNLGNYGYGNLNPNYGYPQANQQQGIIFDSHEVLFYVMFFQINDLVFSK